MKSHSPTFAFPHRACFGRLAGFGLPLAVALTLSGPAAAELTVGVSLALTGPGSALGLPVKNGFDLWPAEIGGEKVKLIILDDTGDPSQATRNARKFATEEKVDVMLGSTQTPGGMAVATVANETRTVHMAFAPIPLSGDKTAWSFVVPQSVTLMADAVVRDIKAKKFKTLGIIGFSDPWGEQWYEALTKGLEGSGTKIVANEKYGRADTSVTGQVLKLVAANPEAILIAGSGTGAALPQTALAERAYKGQVYQTHGAGSSDFLRIAGKSAENTILPIGPVLVPNQLPDSHPSKKVVQTFVKEYQAKFGDKSPVVFGAHSYDAALILQRVVPVALKKAKPGTPEFRTALREAMESQNEIPAVNGVYSFTAKDHYGLDERGAVMVKVSNGNWELLK